MEYFNDLLMGFSIALSIQNLTFALIGCILGTLVGVLPGLGPAAGTALLIPLTFNLPPTGAIIMLAAIYYGSQYGGTITSVLINVPGEASSAITCIDGYEMAKQGRAGAALAIAAIGSFVGGTVAVLGLAAAAPLTRFALEFGPAEFFSLMVLGMALVSGLAGKSMVKALMSAAFGLMLGTIGMDPAQGAPRFTFDKLELLDGIGFISVIMGLFGFGEILTNAEEEWKPIVTEKMSKVMPTLKDLKASFWPIIRGTFIGFFLGLVPGMTGSACSFSSYIAEKKFAKDPSRFGKGAIEGVAGPETANNAHANAAYIPLFTLGIPGSATVAILMGAFMMNGLIPGPFLFVERPDVAWGVIASMYIGNVMLLILNLPLVGIWVRILKIPYSILFAVIMAFMLLGAYATDNSTFDIMTMLVFGILGYLLRKVDIPLAPAVLTLILGPMMEKNLRRALEMSQGDFGIFLESPIAMFLLIAAAIFLITPMLKFLIPNKRKKTE
ncbi:MAG: tripartite tricarboxylate transporter permease [Thermodesulfobacteriota bacterium]